MNLFFDTKKAHTYKSKSQIARVLTEQWVEENSYCPNCGTAYLTAFENNRPVADFYCSHCAEQYELKSKNAPNIGKKVADGAYKTMIERINSDENPNFFFLTYNRTAWSVHNFLIIPKHYFTPDIIDKRKPLSKTAKRAGWVGCNINLSKVPSNGRIFLIQNAEVIPKEKVFNKWKSTIFLKKKKGTAKGWILDIMNCVDAIEKEVFKLKDVYVFEKMLGEKYPDNHFIKDKIRQQLQVMRNRGLIEFVSRGIYKKIQLD